MNRHPDTTGITKRWTEEDARREILKECGTVCGPDQVDRVLLALSKVITRSRRTKIIGFGVFEWKLWKNRIPTGRFIETWRLAFKQSRYSEKYNEKGNRE